MLNKFLLDYFFIILYGTHSTSIQNCSQNWPNSYFLPSYSSTYSGSETRFVNQIRQPCQQQFFFSKLHTHQFSTKNASDFKYCYWLFLKMPNRFGGVNLLWPHPISIYHLSLHDFYCTISHATVSLIFCKNSAGMQEDRHGCKCEENKY